ncbi:hypothetical protein [Streptomyces sp. NPDC055036]
METPEIKITRHYTLPQDTEDYDPERETAPDARTKGIRRVERLVWDELDPVAEWAAQELQNAGCIRDNGRGYSTEERKITDYTRGQEMTATAELIGFTNEQKAEISRHIAG